MTSDVTKYEVGGDFRGNTIKLVKSSGEATSGYILVELTTKKYPVSSLI